MLPFGFCFIFIEQVAIWNESKINGLACGTQCITLGATGRRTQNAKRRTPTATKLPYKMVVKSNTFYLPLFLFCPKILPPPTISHPSSQSFVRFFTRTSCFSFASECPLLRPPSVRNPPFPVRIRIAIVPACATAILIDVLIFGFSPPSRWKGKQ